MEFSNEIVADILKRGLLLIISNSTVGMESVRKYSSLRMDAYGTNAGITAFMPDKNISWNTHRDRQTDKQTDKQIDRHTKSSKNLIVGTGEMAQWLRALTALPEVLSSILSNHMVAHNHL